MNRQPFWKIAAPLLVGVVFLALWEALVRIFGIRAFILPPPSAVAVSLWIDGPSLMGSLWVTLQVTLAALAAAAVFGKHLLNRADSTFNINNPGDIFLTKD